MIKTVNVIILSVVALAAGILGGYKFRDYQLQKQRANFAGGNFRQGAGGNGQFIRNGNGNGARMFGGGVFGEIISTDDKSITVKLQDGSTKIVILSDNTTYNKSAEGSRQDLKTGENVAVMGSANPDGSVTAQNIQLNPQFRKPENASPSPKP